METEAKHHAEKRAATEAENDLFSSACDHLHEMALAMVIKATHELGGDRAVAHSIIRSALTFAAGALFGQEGEMLQIEHTDEDFRLAMELADRDFRGGAEFGRSWAKEGIAAHIAEQSGGAVN